MNFIVILDRNGLKMAAFDHQRLSSEITSKLRIEVFLKVKYAHHT